MKRLSQPFMGRWIQVDKYVMRTAYARNGNAHNPTRYYGWSTYVDGICVASGRLTRKEAIAIAYDVIESGEIVTLMRRALDAGALQRKASA